MFPMVCLSRVLLVGSFPLPLILHDPVQGLLVFWLLVLDILASEPVVVALFYPKQDGPNACGSGKTGRFSGTARLLSSTLNLG